MNTTKSFSTQKDYKAAPHAEQFAALVEWSGVGESRRENLRQEVMRAFGIAKSRAAKNGTFFKTLETIPQNVIKDYPALVVMRALETAYLASFAHEHALLWIEANVESAIAQEPRKVA